MKHLVNWIEIPALDIARAKTFYERLFEISLVEFPFGHLTYAMFPSRDMHNHGALVQGDGYVPSSEGALIYLNATGRLDVLANRIAGLGGKIVTPRTFLSAEAGDIAIFLDTEGNRIGLQAPVARSPGQPVSDETMQSLLGQQAPGFSFLITRGTNYDDPASAPLQWEHARNMFTLMRAGKLEHVSAFMDGSDILGFGIMNASSRDEVESILAADPGIAGGRLDFKVLNTVSFDGERTLPKL